MDKADGIVFDSFIAHFRDKFVIKYCGYRKHMRSTLLETMKKKIPAIYHVVRVSTGQPFF
jgi:hypothetical protein